ncbi:MAG TPA: hypothetical protein VFM65_11845 [Flavobacteriaceae bacterium]|nr:hypothetical protein [Flavobacteriaceae bacterium]
MQKTKATLSPDHIYHIYNRANGEERLFYNNRNYRFFLKKYVHYLQPVVNTLCYCLMPNHFHFLIRVKSEADLKEVFMEKLKKKNANLQGFENLGGLIPQLISKQYSNFFNSYTKAFNKQHQRNGSLFSQNFKRKEVKDETYLRKLIHYIHYNPIEACLTEHYDWKYSSYPAIISTQKTKIAREEVICYFGDLENFEYCHKYPPKITGIE